MKIGCKMFLTILLTVTARVQLINRKTIREALMTSFGERQVHVQRYEVYSIVHIEIICCKQLSVLCITCVITAMRL